MGKYSLGGKSVAYARRVKLRDSLLQDIPHGLAVVAYCGDGSLPYDLYRDRRIIGIDIKRTRVDTAREKMPAHKWLVGDPVDIDLDITEPVSILDIDSPGNPYPALMNILPQIRMTDPYIIFGTDGLRQVMEREKVVLKLPDARVNLKDGDWRTAHQRWWYDHVRPFLYSLTETRVEHSNYYQGKNLMTWGMIWSTKQMEIYRKGNLAKTSPKMTKRRKNKIVSLVRGGATLQVAAKKAGVSTTTVWRAKFIDEDFALDLEDAFEAASEMKTNRVEEAVYKTALGGNVAAQKLWLTNRDPERWGEGGKGGKGSADGGTTNQTTLILQQGGELANNLSNEMILKARELFDELANQTGVTVDADVISSEVLEDKREEEKENGK